VQPSTIFATSFTKLRSISRNRFARPQSSTASCSNAQRFRFGSRRIPRDRSDAEDVSDVGNPCLFRSCPRESVLRKSTLFELRRELHSCVSLSRSQFRRINYLPAGRAPCHAAILAKAVNCDSVADQGTNRFPLSRRQFEASRPRVSSKCRETTSGNQGAYGRPLQKPGQRE